MVDTVNDLGGGGGAGRDGSPRMMVTFKASNIRVTSCWNRMAIAEAGMGPTWVCGASWSAG